MLGIPSDIFYLLKKTANNIFKNPYVPQKVKEDLFYVTYKILVGVGIFEGYGHLKWDKQGGQKQFIDDHFAGRCRVNDITHVKYRGLEYDRYFV